MDRDLVSQVRAMDEYDLRRLVIFAKGLLVQRGIPYDESEPSGDTKVPKVGYRLEKVQCGKRGCTKCPHGPYWYAYWREGGKLRSKYVGRKLPAGVKP